MQPKDTVTHGLGSTVTKCSPNKLERILLLVDDEANILSAVKRLLRGEDYQILTSSSGTDALTLLEKHCVGVIVSDQRMPGMTGVEFFSQMKKLYPDTIRIILSGYTELGSVTDAINEGAIYKFITKPWDDDQLRDHIRSAFEFKELAEENRRLLFEVQTTNHALVQSLQEKQEQIDLNNYMLAIIREVLQHVIIPVLAIDDNNMIVFVNDAAIKLLQRHGPLLGGDMRLLVPELTVARMGTHFLEIEGLRFHAVIQPMGTTLQSRGRLITLMQPGLVDGAV